MNEPTETSPNVLDNYKAPKTLEAEFHLDNSSGVKRVGKKVIFVPKERDLPARCVICNAPAKQPLKRKIFFGTRYYGIGVFVIGLVALLLLQIPEWITFLISISLLLEVGTRYTTKISYGVCYYHQKRRFYAQLIWFGIFISSIGLFFYLQVNVYSVSSTIGYLKVGLLVMVLVSMFGASRLTLRIRSTKVTKEGSYLTGFGKPFIESLQKVKS